MFLTYGRLFWCVDNVMIAKPSRAQLLGMRPARDGAVVFPPRSPNQISGGDALPVPGPAHLRNHRAQPRSCPSRPRASRWRAGHRPEQPPPPSGTPRSGLTPGRPTPRLTRVPVSSRPQSLHRLQHRHRFGDLCARSHSSLLTSGLRPASSSCQPLYDPATPWSFQPASGRLTHAKSSEARGGQPPYSASTDQQARVSFDVAHTRDGRPYENELLPLDDLRVAVV